MNIRNRSILTAAALGISSLTAPAWAYEAGDWIVRGGLAGVFPQDSSSEVSGIDGSGVGVDNGYGVGISLSYMMSSSFAVELLGALPFSHDLQGEGSLSGLGQVGETKHLPPTLLVNYYVPGFAGGTVQPYAGIGVNYTLFFDEDTSESLDGALGNTSLELDDSTGLALQLGADFDVGNDIQFNMALWWIDIDTTGTITSDAGVNTVDVDIDPLVLMIGFAKRF
jgi:outer membrane protein